ncbi:hypothetical protein FGADI_1274 [Fusarium gaditjirri]|uniref:Uncharacterized protein n=1 Tax=Fusarium gaditjirri TaxID=282569 RepID=A0A8H4TLA7_9HYPO|nr:hypothetical protein FGADI_1274 [Fusarium gaditjirri]
MTSSGDRYARDASGFSSPEANITKNHAGQAPQPQRQTTAPQDAMLHQTQHSGTAYYPHQNRSYQQTASIQVTQGYTYAPSNQPAYQGSRITQGSNDAPGDQHQVNLPGAQHSLDDPRQRTTNFVNGQQVRIESSSDEAEQNGIRRALRSVMLRGMGDILNTLIRVILTIPGPSTIAAKMTARHMHSGEGEIEIKRVRSLGTSVDLMALGRIIPLVSASTRYARDLIYITLSVVSRRNTICSMILMFWLAVTPGA